MPDQIKVQTSSGGIGVLGILQIIFVCAWIFEIGPIAAWPWYWVFSPIWIPFAIVCGFFAVVCVVGLLVFGGIALWEYLDRK